MKPTVFNSVVVLSTFDFIAKVNSQTTQSHVKHRKRRRYEP